MAKKRGLGRGLDALFEQKSPNNTDNKKVSTNNISIELLETNPFQPRKNFNEESLRDLMESVKEKGIIQPIVVRNHPDKKNNWQIIAGERRWRAAQKIGLKEVPVFIKNISDEDAATIALIENIQREDLSPLDEAEGYKILIDNFGFTQDQLSKKIGKSRTYIANLLRLLVLPGNVKKLLQNKKLTVGQVRPIIGHKEASLLANQILLHNLNARQVENLLRDYKNKKYIIKNNKDPNIKNLEKQLEDVLGLKTKIIDRNGIGKITFIYKNLDQLDNLLNKIKK